MFLEVLAQDGSFTIYIYIYIYISPEKSTKTYNDSRRNQCVANKMLTSLLQLIIRISLPSRWERLAGTQVKFFISNKGGALDFH